MRVREMTRRIPGRTSRRKKKKKEEEEKENKDNKERQPTKKEKEKTWKKRKADWAMVEIPKFERRAGQRMGFNKSIHKLAVQC